MTHASMASLQAGERAIPATCRPITAIIVGAGHRGLGYATYTRTHPDKMRIVGVADPNHLRCRQAMELFNLSSDCCFASAADLANRPRIADAIINGTMDKEHVPSTLPLLRAGYHVLLEKPIGTTQEEVSALLQTARATRRTVMVCHVLRYAPFYAEIRRRILEGQIGEILNLQTAEHVSYHHLSVAFVRGKWNRKDACGSSLLMAKCCHDLDLLTWMKSGIAPKRIGSFGGRMYFRPDMAPKGSGTRCLVDCPIEPECLYSAKRVYLDHPDRWSPYVWSFLEHLDNPTFEQKIESLKKDNPHGRCMWKCDNDVVDHQSLVIEFADGSTATHNLIGGVARPCRKVHILGSKGEIEGVMEDGSFTIHRPDPRPGHETATEHIDLNISNDMHGGGDLRLVEDFIHVLQGQSPSLSSTHLEDSIYGHLIGFAADQSMEEKRIIEVKELQDVPDTDLH